MYAVYSILLYTVHNMEESNETQEIQEHAVKYSNEELPLGQLAFT